MSSPIPVALTIAGSDSGGGAGIQADLRTFAALGTFGTSAVTCLTAQNLDGVSELAPSEPGIVRAQVEAVLRGFPVRAIKTGMLYSRAIVDVVVEELADAQTLPLVVDPVMIATSGARLLEADAVRAYLERLIPIATVVTPNADELAVLSDHRCDTHEEAIEAGRALLERCGTAVLVKGGHLPGPAHDYLVTLEGVREYAGPRQDAVHTHGSGCTFGAAITAELAHGLGLADAIQAAKQFLSQAFADAPSLRDDLRVLHAGVTVDPLRARAKLGVPRS